MVEKTPERGIRRQTEAVRIRVFPLLVALLVAAVGVPSSPPAAAGTHSRHSLSVQLDVGDGVVQSYTLGCSPTSGNHPNRWAACRLLLKQGAKLFVPVPADAACTMIYGGPQKAIVKGTWNGKRISATFTRDNGCTIAKWDAARALFKVPGMTYSMS